jgi:hypothetical protein
MAIAHDAVKHHVETRHGLLLKAGLAVGVAEQNGDPAR